MMDRSNDTDAITEADLPVNGKPLQLADEGGAQLSTTHAVESDTASTTTTQGPVTRPWPVPPFAYGPHQMKVQCPYCTAYIRTNIEYSVGMFSYIAALTLMAMGCVCCCCLVPCCSPAFKNAEHTCPKCNSYLGIYHRR